MIRQLSLNRINSVSEILKGCLNVLIIILTSFLAESSNNLNPSDVLDEHFAQSKEGFSKESARSSTNKKSQVSLSPRNNNSSNAILTFTLENINNIEETLKRLHDSASLPLRSPPPLLS